MNLNVSIFNSFSHGPRMQQEQCVSRALYAVVSDCVLTKPIASLCYHSQTRILLRCIKRPVKPRTEWNLSPGDTFSAMSSPLIDWNLSLFISVSVRKNSSLCLAAPSGNALHSIVACPWA